MQGLGVQAQREEMNKIRQQLGSSLAVAVGVLNETNITDSIISLTVVRSIWWDHSSRASSKLTAKDHAQYSCGVARGSWITPLRQVLFDSLAKVPNLVKMGLDCSVAGTTLRTKGYLEEQDFLAKKISNLAVPTQANWVQQQSSCEYVGLGWHGMHKHSSK